MADVKWVKITVDMFDNRKIKHLRRLPDGDSIVLIWVMLLTMAGRCNAGGMIYLTEDIPYTPKMLADELDFDESTVLLALDAFAKLGMVLTDGEYLSIAGWEEHQNTEGLDRIREQNRIRKQKQRQLQAENTPSRDSHVMSRDCHATEEEREGEKEKESIDYQGVVAAYNAICVSLPKAATLSADRKKAIKARLGTYKLGDFKTLFEKAEASSFLRGANDRNWQANFDWLIKDKNMAKVLDGNYDDRDKPQTRNGRAPSKKAEELDQFYAMAQNWAEE